MATSYYDLDAKHYGITMAAGSTVLGDRRDVPHPVPAVKMFDFRSFWVRRRVNDKLFTVSGSDDVGFRLQCFGCKGVASAASRKAVCVTMYSQMLLGPWWLHHVSAEISCPNSKLSQQTPRACQLPTALGAHIPEGCSGLLSGLRGFLLDLLRLGFVVSM